VYVCAKRIYHLPVGSACLPLTIPVSSQHSPIYNTSYSSLNVDVGKLHVCGCVCVCVCEEKLPFASRICMSPSHHPCKLPTLTTTQFQLQLYQSRYWEAACVCVCVCVVVIGNSRNGETGRAQGELHEVLRYMHFRMVRISCGRSNQNLSKPY